jgi:3-hydroxybutyryl-CoA dehydrogenase
MGVREISRVGIVGSGTMGPKIAYRCAVSGLETYLYDKYPEVLAQAVDRIAGWLAARVESGQLSAEQADLARATLHACTTLEDCVGDADLVIETVPENLELKRRVFAEIDRLAPRGALICTNSSSLPCSRIADATGRPEKIFNINYSNPVDDKLVEVMKGADTAMETIRVAEAFVRSTDMVPIVTLREIMGFSFNRIWRAIKKECLHLVADGYSNFEDIDRAWMLEFGMSFGPFGLMDIVGLDVIRDIENQYYYDSGDEADKPPQFLEDMIGQGRLGVKSGRGFYTYPSPEYEQESWLLKVEPWTPDQAINLSD